LFPLTYAAEPLYVSVHVDRAYENGMIMVTLFGEVTRANEAPVTLAAVSVEVSDPYGSSVHIAFLHSANDGSYSDTFELESNHSTGDYTIYVTATKVGYEDAQATLTFKIGVTPFSISISPALLTITKGETAIFRIGLESKEQLSSVVHIEVMGLPASISYSLSSDNVTSPSTVTLTVMTSELTPGSYRLTAVGRSREGESKASAEIIVTEANKSGYYVIAAVLVIAFLSTILVYKRRTAVKKQIEPPRDVPEYLDRLALSPSTLLSLPDHLRKTAIIICNLKEASANEVASRSGRARAAESDYLNQLVRMGLIKKKRKGRESFFFIE